MQLIMGKMWYWLLNSDLLKTLVNISLSLLKVPEVSYMLLTSVWEIFFSPQILDVLASTQTGASWEAAMEVLDFSSEEMAETLERFLVVTAFNSHPTESQVEKLMVCLQSIFKKFFHDFIWYNSSVIDWFLFVYANFENIWFLSSLCWSHNSEIEMS